jgi:hypothetical protein
MLKRNPEMKKPWMSGRTIRSTLPAVAVFMSSACGLQGSGNSNTPAETNSPVESLQPVVGGPAFRSISGSNGRTMQIAAERADQINPKTRLCISGQGNNRHVGHRHDKGRP